MREELRLYRMLGEQGTKALDELGRRLESEPMPEGWLCARAPRGSIEALR